MENGEYQIVFLTPEMLLMNKRCRNMLISKVYSTKLKSFVVDEAHTIRTWLVLYDSYIMHHVYFYKHTLFINLRGQSFREIMSRIGEIESLLPSQVPILALTATITKNDQVKVSKTLGLRKEAVIVMSPSKSKTKFIKMPLLSIEGSFNEVAEDLIHNFQGQ